MTVAGAAIAAICAVPVALLLWLVVTNVKDRRAAEEAMLPEPEEATEEGEE